jgi:N-acyl-D-aspartate/D-glutamate deacylase
MNAYLKEIADLAGIDKNLTTHIARHTFATTVTLDNDVPLESVSKMLGHTKLTTTQIYARTKDRKVNRDMTALKNRLKEQKALAEGELGMNLNESIITDIQSIINNSKNQGRPRCRPRKGADVLANRQKNI